MSRIALGLAGLLAAATPAQRGATHGQGVATAGDLIPAARRTVWRPGIPGGIPQVTTVHTTIDAAAYGTGSRDATAAINAAIGSAGDEAARTGRAQVVHLPPGVYRTTGPLNLNRSRVVLRGAGPARTKIRLDSTGSVPVIRFGIIWPTYQEAAWNVLGDVPKGSTRITLSSADASAIEVGDVLQMDQQDAPYVWLFDSRYRKRQPTSDASGPGTGAAPFKSVSDPGGPWRSVGQQIEIASKKVGVETTVLELSGPVHVDFQGARHPQVFQTATARAGQPGVRDSGIEDLYVTGGNQGNVATANLAYCWMKNIESDGDPRTVLPGTYASPGGMDGQHVDLLHAYRCVIRDSYFHHARSINQGGGAYGISVGNSSSDNLVENNIVVHLNKPVLMNDSGGGNVVGYNYVDEAYSTAFPSWQENSIDGNHEAFSHHDLFEGNWTVNIGSDSTHGNCGWQTFFRNYAPGMNTSMPRTTHVRAVGIDGYDREHNIVGNVLLQPDLVVNGRRPEYECIAFGPCMSAAAVYRIGANVGSYGGFDDGTALRMLYRHGNYDYVTKRVVWDPRVSTRELPPSLYLTEKPAFFGNLRWPWVDPLGATKVYTLPAKQRFDAMH